MGKGLTPLRAHHTRTIRELEMGINEYGELMVEEGYSIHKSDSFTVQTYNFLENIRKDPSNKILITAGGTDFFCKACSETKKTTCGYYNPKVSILYGGVFWDPIAEVESIDKKFAKETGLEIGKIYTVKEILEAIKDQPQRYNSELRKN